MTVTNLTTEHLFDISSFPFKDLFAHSTYPWEALPKIEQYITSLFKEKKLVGNYQEREDVFIGEGTVIQPGVEIVGPAIIGSNCLIGHASLLRNGCIIGDNVHIGHAVEIKHSVLLNGSAAAHLNYIGDSVIGNNVNLSGGSILANFRLDKQPVMIKTGDERIETGLQKCGAMIGDGANIGVNAVLNPGTVLGKDCIVYPLQLVTGVYEKTTIIKK